MSTYTSDTPDDRAAMLAAIGAKSIDDLFADIPAGVRLQRDLDLPAGKAEFEVFDHLS
ncbi:MAG: glycine dehydrogenase, partial [Thermoleophilaceae bacterium]|nr:glycine dehydrogenase [Thermoleophilaceae bacterium]